MARISNKKAVTSSSKSKDGPRARLLVVAVTVLGFCILVHELAFSDGYGSRLMMGDTGAAAAAAGLVVATPASKQVHENMYKSCLADPLPPIRVRDDIATELEAMNFTSGIEIGVQRGIFSEHNLQNWPSCQKYYLVDLWGQQPNYKDVANVDDAKQEQLFEETKTRLAPYENKIEYHRMYSNEAAQKLALAGVQVDFVYVDARHDYCGCKEDMELYWPLVKPGGVMAGHDFAEDSEVRGQDWSVCMDGSIHPEAVRGAVIEFSKKRKLSIGLTYREAKFNSWWIRKPLC
mmetsp:Transcript_25556/g.60441  ORF Transcript_25556/g.60441 Transcript_25556/m.60441 type:complete len:290 (+) Transcript_25556:75-944(+)